MQHIIQHLFQTTSLENVSRQDLEEMVDRYPSFGIARYLLSRKLQTAGDETFRETTLKTNLYFSNPYWLQWQLRNETPLPATHSLIPDPQPAIMQPEPVSVEHPAEPGSTLGIDRSFEPASDTYHIDEGAPEIETSPGTENNVPEASGPELQAHETSQEIETPSGENIEPEPREPPRISAADQLLASIAELRQTQHQVPENPDISPALSLASLALEQADEDAEKEEFESFITPEPTPDEEIAKEEFESFVTPETTPGEDAAPAAIETEAPSVQPQADVPAPVQATADPAAQPHAATISPTPTSPLGPLVEIEPYHTIDYFASQGIKLSLDENPSDKLGRQLKSFTDWLKTMRRLPQKNQEPVPDLAAEHQVRTIAAHSIESREVLTEAMAEVLAKQGMREKATEVYQKLSLLNPDKSSYFANKIEQLKID